LGRFGNADLIVMVDRSIDQAESVSRRISQLLSNKLAIPIAMDAGDLPELKRFRTTIRWIAHGT
jgi:hypothetical protein